MRDTKPDFAILLLGFNRPHFLAKTLESVKVGSDFSEAKVFLSLDGPRGEVDVKSVQECRQLFDEFAKGRSKVSTLYSPENQGLRKNVMSSVSRAMEKVNKLLVLEDDCIIGESSIGFFNWGFRQLDSRDGVGAISGNYLGPEIRKSAFLAKRFSSWGWATEKKTWQAFLESKYSQLSSQELRREMLELTKDDPLPYRYEYRNMANNLSSMDSWAVPFDLFLRSQNLYTVKPSLNQIHNIGFGEGATHTVRGSSLSLETKGLDESSLELASPDESISIERAEAWVKFGRLVKELLSG